MVPKYRNTLYTGRILQGYIVISLVLLVILVFFYAMFLLIANSLNKNARLVQENHFLSLQQARYENLRSAIEEARQARHDLRHHFVQLSALAENGDLDKIKEYLSCASSKIPSQDLHFCENQAADGVLGYYSALAKLESIPFHAKTDLPSHIAVDEIDMCLVLSNLLENAIQASQKTEVSRRKINVEIYLHYNHLLLIQVENTFDGEIRKKMISSSHPNAQAMESESSPSATSPKKPAVPAASPVITASSRRRSCCARVKITLIHSRKTLRQSSTCRLQE